MQGHVTWVVWVQGSRDMVGADDKSHDQVYRSRDWSGQ